MDLLHDKNFSLDTFVVLTSDGDFTRLMQRLRQANMMVIGVGEEHKSGEMIRNACDAYILTEDLMKAEEERLELIQQQQEETIRLAREEEKRIAWKKKAEAKKEPKIEQASKIKKVERERKESVAVTSSLKESISSWWSSVALSFELGAPQKLIASSSSKAAPKTEKMTNKNVTVESIPGLDADIEKVSKAVQQHADAEGWANLSHVAKHSGVNHSRHGFKKFKQFVDAAPKTFTVRSRNKDLVQMKLNS